MPLEFRRQRDGSLRDIWFGAFEINGKRYGINLGVKIAGTPPASLSLKDKGDTDYEVSRMAALAKLEHFIEEARKKNHSEHLVEKLYEIKTGEAIQSVKLGTLADEWEKIERRRVPNARYAAQCKSTLTRFVVFVRHENPKAVEMAHVTRSVARAFMDAEAKRGVTGKTWNDTLKLLRATFKYLLPAGGINPFAGTPTRETETVFRQPFTPEELAAITEESRADEFIRPIIIVGMCTAMRRGDCCLLKWEDVDLKKKFITVKTSKTGQTVSIPIFPMLFDELAKRKASEKVKMDGYVFPEAARMYLENPDGITWRVKKILAAGLGEAVVNGDDTKTLLEVSDAETRKRGEGFIAKLPNGTKRERMGLVFKLYMEGKNIEAVVASAKVSKGSVSGYLNKIQTAIGCQIVRGASRTGQWEPVATPRASGPTGANLKTEMADGGLQVARKHGLRRASVRDFHSLRVTWVTLALTAGVPLELVQKVTGHKTAAIVMKHYFQPGREDFRQALQSAMPKLLTNGQISPREEMREILSRTTSKTWIKDKTRMKELLNEL
jgi:integrase